VAGHLTAVSPTSIAVRPQIGGDDLTLTVVGDPSVKSVVVKELSDIPDGTYVTVEGPLSDDRSTIAARRITVPLWIKRADGRIGADSASGTLTVTGDQATLDVGNTQIAVATSGPPKPYVTFQDRLSVVDLEVGDKVLVNGKKVGDTSILSGVFVYRDSG
jgi:YbbR domain-containing protein